MIIFLDQPNLRWLPQPTDPKTQNCLESVNLTDTDLQVGVVVPETIPNTSSNACFTGQGFKTAG